MDNIGDWLYIVFLIIAGISGIISSAKKKKRSAEMPQPSVNDTFPEEQPEEKKSFWDILQEMQQEDTEPEVIIQEEKVLQKKYKTPPPIPFFTERENVVSSIKKEATIPLPIKEENIQDSSFQNMEELRKAIIYTEILNRKY